MALGEKLRKSGLRPTKQRLALAHILFAGGDRHVCAESLHAEAVAQGIKVSLATVYNALNQMKTAGLLREIATEGDRSYYDTNTSNHYHFLDEVSGELHDIAPGTFHISGLPVVPKGRAIDRIDVIVRLKASR